MIEAWAVVLTPFLLLPIVLLFRFVGCGLDRTGELEPEIPLPPRKDPPPPKVVPPSDPPPITTPPNYQKYILGESPNPGLVKNPGVVPSGADVIAYWRLVDPPADTRAEDKKLFQHGTYKSGDVLPSIAPTATAAGSTGRNPAHFVPGQPSLLDSEPAVACRRFEGGHVRVDFKAGLYTDTFTIEAWILADAFSPDFEYVLFDAGGNYALSGGSAANRGFRVFVNRQKGWQVQLAPGNASLFGAGPLVPVGARTHIAVTVDDIVIAAGGVEKAVSLYVDGKLIPPSPVTVLVYNRPDGAPLFIGVENEEQNPAQAARPRRPIICRIQEVVLHRKALTLAEIENHVDINRK